MSKLNTVHSAIARMFDEGKWSMEDQECFEMPTEFLECPTGKIDWDRVNATLAKLNKKEFKTLVKECMETSAMLDLELNHGGPKGIADLWYTVAALQAIDRAVSDLA